MKKRILCILLVLLLSLALVPSVSADVSGTGLAIATIDGNQVLFDTETFRPVPGPLWLTVPGYRNNNAVGTRVAPNKALFNAVDQFTIHDAPKITEILPTLGDFEGARFPVNAELNERFSSLIKEGWKNESFAAVMPFNQTWFDDVIVKGVDYVFSATARNQWSTGQYLSHAPENSQLFMSVEWPWVLSALAMHEIAHSMGLGESLADLFSEELMGRIPREPLAANNGLLDKTVFDRALLRKMENLGRGNVFWAAAFHSNAEYERLWNEHMSQYISFRDLNVIRRTYDGIIGAVSGSIPGLEASFRSIAGVTHEAAEQDLLRIWDILHGHVLYGNSRPSAADEARALQELKAWVEVFNRVAKANNYGPFEYMVLDHVMANHHIRYDPAYQSRLEYSRATEVILPAGVLVIKDGWFNGWPNLKTVIIPDTVKEIGEGAFAHSHSLAEITIPGSVTKIATLAFLDGKNLRDVYIPPSVTFIGEYALINCPNLTIHGVIGSRAESYAREQNIKFMEWTPPLSAPNLETADSWARDEIISAVNKGFVPSDLQGRYKDVITRLEFCRMAIKFVEYATGKTIDSVMAEKGVTRNAGAFNDTSDPDILAAFALGITNGTGDKQFTPNGSIDREQAATMLMRLAKVIGIGEGNPPPSGFADIGSASDWAVDGIDFCFANGIMQGTGGNLFSPKDTFTRQQSIMTFDRIG